MVPVQDLLCSHLLCLFWAVPPLGAMWLLCLPRGAVGGSELTLCYAVLGFGWVCWLCHLSVQEVQE